MTHEKALSVAKRYWWLAALLFVGALFMVYKIVGSWTMAASKIIYLILEALVVALVAWFFGAEITVAAVIGLLIGSSAGAMCAYHANASKSTAVTDMSATSDGS